jgi:hypothetical protein
LRNWKFFQVSGRKCASSGGSTTTVRSAKPRHKSRPSTLEDAWQQSSAIGESPDRKSTIGVSGIGISEIPGTKSSCISVSRRPKCRWCKGPLKGQLASVIGGSAYRDSKDRGSREQRVHALWNSEVRKSEWREAPFRGPTVFIALNRDSAFRESCEHMYCGIGKPEIPIGDKISVTGDSGHVDHGFSLKG